MEARARLNEVISWKICRQEIPSEFVRVNAGTASEKVKYNGSRKYPPNLTTPPRPTVLPGQKNEQNNLRYGEGGCNGFGLQHQ
jgi:hypothetical protein